MHWIMLSCLHRLMKVEIVFRMALGVWKTCMNWKDSEVER
jgi:hypothetical protein